MLPQRRAARSRSVPDDATATADDDDDGGGESSSETMTDPRGAPSPLRALHGVPRDADVLAIGRGVSDDDNDDDASESEPGRGGDAQCGVGGAAPARAWVPTSGGDLVHAYVISARGAARSLRALHGALYDAIDKNWFQHFRGFVFGEVTRWDTDSADFAARYRRLGLPLPSLQRPPRGGGGAAAAAAAARGDDGDGGDGSRGGRETDAESDAAEREGAVGIVGYAPRIRLLDQARHGRALPRPHPLARRVVRGCGSLCGRCIWG